MDKITLTFRGTSVIYASIKLVMFVVAAVTYKDALPSREAKCLEILVVVILCAEKLIPVAVQALLEESHKAFKVLSND